MGEITTFTPEELAVLSKKPSAVVREKIEATGSKDALEAFDAFVAGVTGMHDSFITWITYAMSAAYDGGAADLLQEYMKAMWKDVAHAAVDGIDDLPFKDRVMMSLANFRDTHDADIEFLGEDDEKLQFKMKPCGSGQRLCEMGIYAPDGKCSMCKADPGLTAGLDNFPVYCTHAPIYNVLFNDLGEYPPHTWDYPEKMGTDACVITVYKDRTKTPDRYFEAIGRKRPQK